MYIGAVYFTYILFIINYNVNNKCSIFHLFTTTMVIIMDTNKAFALRISKLLIEKKMSKYKLEKESGLTHSALRYIFNEVNKDVKFSTIVKICNALDISLTEFFNDPVFDLHNLDFE